eukprot:7628458-Pyramimonas_sp.AAC.1
MRARPRLATLSGGSGPSHPNGGSRLFGGAVSATLRGGKNGGRRLFGGAVPMPSATLRGWKNGGSRLFGGA